MSNISSQIDVIETLSTPLDAPTGERTAAPRATPLRRSSDRLSPPPAPAAGKPAVAADAQVSAGLRRGRWIRIGLAAGAVVTAALFIHDRLFVLSANRAVLSPVAISLRAPIAGTLMVPDAEPGRLLPAGTVLGHVRDAMADETRLVGLRARVQALETEAAALAGRLSAAEGEIEVAGTRSGAFQEARLRQLRARLDESRANEAAAMARLREASSAIRRGERLVGSSAIAPAAVDTLTRNQRVAEREVAALQERRRALQAEHDAAAMGIFTSDNSTDRSVSQQTEDRLRLLRAELRAQIAERRGQADIVRGQLAIEQRGFEARHNVPLPAPAQARLMALHAQNGEFVSQGQEIATLLDCGRQMVVAEVTERVFTRLTTGQRAEFRPQSGADAALQGEVVRLLSPINTTGAGADPRHRVEIRMDRLAAETGCEGARSGSVNFLGLP